MDISLVTLDVCVVPWILHKMEYYTWTFCDADTVKP